MKDSVSLELLKLSNSHPIIAFDGECILCNGFINWVRKKDRKQIFRYITLQSNAGLRLKDAIPGDTVFLIHLSNVYSKSDVALRCFKILGGATKVLYVGMIVPRFIRDFIYDIIAKYRYSWFGKRDACMIPDKEWKKQFIS